MHAIKFRLTVALVLAGLLSAAGIVEMARSASLADTDCPTEPRVLDSIIDSGTGVGRGDQTEVRWSSLIPGSFK